MRGFAAGWALLALSLVAPACVAPEGGSLPRTERGAREFLARAEQRLLERWVTSERANWIQENFITVDTELAAADARRDVLALTRELALAATRFDGLDLAADTARKLRLLKTSLPLAAPADPAAQSELALIAARMASIYGKGRYCRPDGTCLELGALEEILATSRDPAELLEAWRGWHAIAPPLAPLYARFVELANAGARDLGFADLGELWRSGYDMPADELRLEVDRLWEQVRPLYEALHCYVRARLGERYGTALVPPDGPIPAHLLGNMWAQSWDGIYDLVGPADVEPGYDLTQLLRARGLDARAMVRVGESFFTSLGFAPLPETFWERSLFTKPRDRDVVCHASAWDIDWVDDLRIKMCIEPSATDLVTIHHELGHNFYQRAYNRLDPLHRNGAHDGFHEGIGDALALSITPAYLVRIGLLEALPARTDEIGLQLRSALDKVAFLPFGLVVDQWRWKVFAGEVAPRDYNAAWWELRERYQGVASPVARGADDFDPGAKYHVPANTPYTRYFLADILQYQFHRALCAAAGQAGSLRDCSIYGSTAAGARLAAMLSLGASRPWPDALEALTGTREMDATAMLDYYAPLRHWLDDQNRGRACGW